MNLIFLIIVLFQPLKINQEQPILLKFQDLKMSVELEETWNKPEYFERVHSDTLIVELGLVSEISGQLYSIELSESVKNIAIFQNYETSLTLMDEGPHVDLTNWKHYQSDWEQLKISDNKFRTFKYSDADNNKFPSVSTVEIVNAVKEHLNDQDDRWAELAKKCNDANSAPCGVSISRINLKIELTNKNGTTSAKYIIFEVPMGC
jgi:hypothetical protein